MFSMLIRLVLTGLLEGYSWCWRRALNGNNDVVLLPPSVATLAHEVFTDRNPVHDRSRWTAAAEALQIDDQPFQYTYRFIKQVFRTNTFDARIYLSNFIAKHAPDMPVENASGYAQRNAGFQLAHNPLDDE